MAPIIQAQVTWQSSVPTRAQAAPAGSLWAQTKVPENAVTTAANAAISPIDAAASGATVMQTA